MITTREEMRRLLALYREGRVNEEELLRRLDSRLENESLRGATVVARRALAELLDAYRAAEASGAETIAAWAERSVDPSLVGGLRVVAAREAAHAALLERRVRELGRTPSTEIPSWLVRYNEALLSDYGSDEDRLAAVILRFPDIEAALAPLRDKIETIDDDPLTRELLRAIAEDEEATLRWMHDALAQRKRQA